jgi:hypothetical protein
VQTLLGHIERWLAYSQAPLEDCAGEKEMNPYKKQVGGSHYKDMKIQPAQFINENNLPFAEGNAIKYICRHKHKGEVQDLEKAKHYIDMIIERDYS